MTTNKTIDGVPRDLLQKIADGAYCHQGLMDRLRALLDAERCTSCDGSGDLIDLTGEWRGYCVCPAGVALKNKPAAQPQGEPVAVMYADGSVLTKAECGIAFETCCKVETPLYAEQPAPVAVVIQGGPSLHGQSFIKNCQVTCCGSCPGGCTIGNKP